MSLQLALSRYLVNVKLVMVVRPDEAPPEELAVAEVLWLTPKL